MKTLIVKYLNDNISKEEIEQLREWLKLDQNKKVFKSYFQDAHAVTILYNNVDQDKAFEKVWKSIKDSEKPVKRLIPKWSKYAAAAIIVLGLGYFLRNVVNDNAPAITPTVVKNTIKTGTDKATLTLANGEEVALEKGNSVQTQNATSNGEELIYKEDLENTKIAYNTLTIPRGGEYYVKLSDGTQVWLNSASKLKFPVTFIEGQTRKVELIYGEAYFDVSPSSAHKGAKFNVFNQAQEVEVLGTEFNVKAYQDETNVYTTLVEGKVSIHAGDLHQLLKPGQQANLHPLEKTIAVAEVNVYNETSWKDGVFSFRGKPLNEIMKVLSRWYDIDVVYDQEDLKNIPFKGVIGKNQPIEDILTIIVNASTLNSYEITKNTILLK